MTEAESNAVRDAVAKRMIDAILTELKGKPFCCGPCRTNFMLETVALVGAGMISAAIREKFVVDAPVEDKAHEIGVAAGHVAATMASMTAVMQRVPADFTSGVTHAQPRPVH